MLTVYSPKGPFLLPKSIFVLVHQVETLEKIKTEPSFVSIEKVVANILNQRQIGYALGLKMCLNV